MRISKFLFIVGELLIYAVSASELHPYVFIGEQLLLTLYWTITMDKSQSQSIKKTGIYLGKSEATARLAFGCLSRAKRLVDLLVEPMAFDRLSKLGDKSTQNIRLGSSAPQGARN